MVTSLRHHLQQTCARPLPSCLVTVGGGNDSSLDQCFYLFFYDYACNMINISVLIMLKESCRKIYYLTNSEKRSIDRLSIWLFEMLFSSVKRYLIVYCGKQLDRLKQLFHIETEKTRTIKYRYNGGWTMLYPR